MPAGKMDHRTLADNASAGYSDIFGPTCSRSDRSTQDQPSELSPEQNRAGPRCRCSPAHTFEFVVRFVCRFSLRDQTPVLDSRATESCRALAALPSTLGECKVAGRPETSRGPQSPGECYPT